MNIPYLSLRLVRHFMPPTLARSLLRMNLVIRPGLETSDPQAAAERYQRALEEQEISLESKRVLIFGYGGRFEVGCRLLQAGARHVILCDPFAPPDQQANASLLPEFSRFLRQEGSQVQPNTDYLTLLQSDIRQTAAAKGIPAVDLVVSSSVFEHLDDVEEITQPLAALTNPEGAHLHFIDLRDHFFRYPFEMLAYKEKTWQRYLNPTSNLNRYRIRDYQRAFAMNFTYVSHKVLERDSAAFEKTRPRIRLEFLTGDPEVDAVTQVQVFARSPIRAGQ